MMDKVQFKAVDWVLIEDDNPNRDDEKFYISGRTKENKSVMVKVEGFHPFCFIELPDCINWKESSIELLQEYLDSKLANVKRKGKEADFSPLSLEFTKKHDFYFNQEKNYLKCTMKNHAACKNLDYFFERTHTIRKLGTFNPNEFKVHENNVDPLIKFTSVRQLKLGSWVQTKGEINEGNERFTTCDIDMVVDWTNVKYVDVSDKIQPKYKVMCFDFETYSNNHNSKLPDPTNPKNVISQVSIITAENDQPIEQWKVYLMTLKKGVDIKIPYVHINSLNIDLPVERIDNCIDEKDLILRFKTFIQKYDPDYITGYNILKFDWDYIVKRAELLGIYDKFCKISRVKGEKAIIVTKDWTSSAYGEQKFQFVQCQGRSNIDVFPEIERNWKFDMYNLDFVSGHFLKESKRPVSAKQMFKLTKFADLTARFYKKEMNINILRQIKQIARNILGGEEDKDSVVKEFLDKILKANQKNILQIVSEAMAIMGEYCIYDSILTMMLLFKLKLLYNLSEMATIFGVPKSYLQTRGQQVKVLSQVYSYTHFNDIIIPNKKYNPPSDENYQGATVIEANKGFYNDIATLDFASLYPSVMIANNIDPSSYVKDDDENAEEIDDKDCNIIEWTEHKNCVHDPIVILKKQKDYEKELKSLAKKEKLNFEDYLNKHKINLEQEKKNFENAKEEIEEKEEEEEEVKQDKKTKKVILCGHFKHRFKKTWKDEEGNIQGEGVFPKLLRNLLMERKRVKGVIKDLSIKLSKGEIPKNEIEQTKVMLVVLDAKQLAIKISANSIYGSLAARTGPFPFIPGAASTTAGGRQYIRTAIDYILKHHKDAKLVYGDSVTGDTPILVKDKEGFVDIIQIQDLGTTEWEEYENFKPRHLEKTDYEDLIPELDIDKWGKDTINIENMAIRFMYEKSNRREKEKCFTDYKVWTDQGWSKINKLIRHKVDKDIYRINTHTGVVDVTEDHSLLDKEKNILKPKDAKIGQKLLHSFPKKFEVKNFQVNSRIIPKDEPFIKCSKCKKTKPISQFHKGGINKKRYDRCYNCKECRKNGTVKSTVYIDELDYNKKYDISEDEAWVWGFFFADGSCGSYKYEDSTKYSWAINNQNLEYLKKAKSILEKIEPYTFKILDTMNSSNVYKLVPNNSSLKHIVNKYSVLYHKNTINGGFSIRDRHKIVPKEILNADKNIRRSFYQGYYIGDGYKKADYQSFSNKGKIGTQGLWYLIKSLGHDKSCINIRNDKPDIYRIQSFDKQRKQKTEIKKIENLGRSSDYVYDIETECGRYQAGIGEIIVKNTDSCMIDFNCNNLKKTFELGTKFAKEVSALFPPPVELEFECVYGKFFLFTKKRYIAKTVNDKGEVTGTTNKGVVTKRRDNAKFLRFVYNRLMDNILDKTELDKVLYELQKDIHMLFTRQVEPRDLCIYKSIKSLINYANKVTKNDPSGKMEEKDVFEGGVRQRINVPVKLKYFIDKNKNPIMDEKGQPVHITDPLDPRLFYNNMVHTNLARKMIERGDDVPPNTRLQYVILDEGNPKIKQSERAEDYVFYKENKNKLHLKIDHLFYLSNQLTKPITEVLGVIDKPQEIKYVSLKDKIAQEETKILGRYKIKDLAKNVIDQLHKLFKNFGVKKCVKCKKEHKGKNTKVCLNNKGKKYRQAPLEYKKEILNIFDENRLLKNKSTFAKLIHLLYMSKSELVIAKLEKKFGLKKTPHRRPNQQKMIKVGTCVLMKDITKYRTNYHEVVKHLKYMFTVGNVEIDE